MANDEIFTPLDLHNLAASAHAAFNEDGAGCQAGGPESVKSPILKGAAAIRLIPLRWQNSANVTLLVDEVDWSALGLRSFSLAAETCLGDVKQES